MATSHCLLHPAKIEKKILARNCIAAMLFAFAGNAYGVTDGPIRLIPLSNPEQQLAIVNNQLVLGNLGSSNESDLVLNEVKEENGDTFYYIAQRSDPTALLNIQTGNLNFSLVPKEWWSAQWIIHDKDGIIKLVSRWKPGIAIGLSEAGNLEAVPETSQYTNWKAISLERDSKDGVDFSKAGLLAQPGSTLASNTSLQLVEASTLNENSALLARRLKDDIYRFISFDGDIVLSLNVEKGGIGLSQIAPDWWSGHWISTPSPADENTLLFANRWKPDLILARSKDGKLYAAKKEEVDLASPKFHWNIATASGEIINKPKAKPQILDEKKLFTRQMLEVVDEEYVADEASSSSETVSSYPEPAAPKSVLPGSSITRIPDSPANTAASYYASLQLENTNSGDDSGPLDATNITIAQDVTKSQDELKPVSLETSPTTNAVNEGKNLQTAALEPSTEKTVLSDGIDGTMTNAENRLEENFKYSPDDQLAEQAQIAEALKDSAPEQQENQSLEVASAKPADNKNRDTIEPVIVKPGSREAEAAKLPDEDTIKAAEKRTEKQDKPSQVVSSQVKSTSAKQPAPAKVGDAKASRVNEEEKVPETKLASLMKRIHGEVVTGNSNSEEVGPWQAYTKLYANDLLGKGETIWLIGDTFGWGKELKAVRGGIDLPINKERDWHIRYNFHISNIKPTPVEDDFKWLDINEREQNLELFKVTEKEGHRNETGVFFNYLDSEQNKQELNDDAPRDLGFTSRDLGLFTAGYFWKEDEETKLAGNYYMSLAKGIDMFGASDYFEVRDEAEPFPLVWKGRFNIRHDWKKTGWHVAASAAAHYADRTSEWHKHFALGGLNYASGFSSAEAAGEVGAGVWVEAGKAFPASLQLAQNKIDFNLTPYARADIGHVYSRYIDPTDSLDYMRTTTLTSAMAGVRVDHKKWSFDFGYAHPLSGKSRFEDGENGRFVFSSSVRW